MERHVLTTSFGRRPAAYGQIAAQIQVHRAIDEAALPGSNAPAAVNKWHLFRTLTEIRERLGLSDRSLGVLNALLSFHPETALTLPKRRPSESATDADGGEARHSCDLVVFPSNKALAARAHGMASMTLWRHLKALTDAGLVIRRDSPNGKRYARKDATGQERFSDVFGFDLTPLVARAGEFESLAEEVKAAQKRRYLLKERISLLRRDVSKLIGLGLDEGLPGDWEALRLRAMGLMTPLRRIPELDQLVELEAALVAIRDEAAKSLESKMDAQDSMSNAHQDVMHQSNSNTDAHNDFEPASKEEGASLPGSLDDAACLAPERKNAEAEPYPLGMVLEACPDVGEYAPTGKVRNWNDFVASAAAVRPMIGISPEAWTEAQEVLGRPGAHIAVATILQRSIHSSEAETRAGLSPGTTEIVVNGSPAIRSAGGYLRALTEKARAGEFALGPVLMALMGQRLKVRRANRISGL